MAEERDPNDKIIEIPRTRMFGKPVQGANRSPQLAWCIWRANPRITVFINGPQDQAGKGVISAPMDPTTMYVLLDDILKIIDGPNGSHEHMTCWTTAKNDNNSAVAAEKILLSEVHYGKDDKGIVWISIQAKDQPKIRFDYRMSDWHELFIDGQPASESTSSMKRARGAIKLLKEVYPQLVAKTDATAINQLQTAQRDKQKVTKTFENFDDDVTF